MTLLRRAVPAAVAVAAVAVHDLVQRRHALLRNFPVVGHARYLLEAVGPELRQYVVAGNDEERPFSRDQRRWVYASSKLENNYFGFGTDNDIEHTPSYPIVKHATFARVAPPSTPSAGQEAWVPCAKVLGAARGRRGAFRQDSVVNFSAMSFGSLSGPAVEALNRGAALAGCTQNTGEGGLSPASPPRRRSRVPDRDGLLRVPRRAGPLRPGAPEGARRVGSRAGPRGQAVPGGQAGPRRPVAGGQGVSRDRRHPGHPHGQGLRQPVTPRRVLRHRQPARLGRAAGGRDGTCRSASSPPSGTCEFWYELGDLMARGDRGVDFITIDGGEGGTGAAPLIFTDSVAMPFRIGFARVYGAFAERGLHERVVFTGAGKLGLPDNAVIAFALGADTVNVGREAMLAIGCIQAQKCHTDRCPTGVATQNRWLTRGLDPTLKSVRAANYVKTLRRDLLKVSEACGVEHPGLIDADAVELLDAVDRRPARCASCSATGRTGPGRPLPTAPRSSPS